MPGGRGKITGKDGKPFVKNDPRINRKGVPKKLPELEVILTEALTEIKNGKTSIEDIIEALKKKAKSGDVRAAELILNRAYGKVPDKVDLTTNGKELPPPNFNFMALEDE